MTPEELAAIRRRPVPGVRRGGSPIVDALVAALGDEQSAQDSMTVAELSRLQVGGASALWTQTLASLPPDANFMFRSASVILAAGATGGPRLQLDVPTWVVWIRPWWADGSQALARLLSVRANDDRAVYLDATDPQVGIPSLVFDTLNLTNFGGFGRIQLYPPATVWTSQFQLAGTAPAPEEVGIQLLGFTSAMV